MLQLFKMSRHSLAVGLAVGALGLVGLPFMSSVPAPLTAQPAIAQSSVSDDEIRNYAMAVLAMDEPRKQAYTAIEAMLTSDGRISVNEVALTCSSARNLGDVPRSIRRDVEKVLFGYCNQAREIVASNGLTPQRFNEITNTHQEDETVSELIQQELILLQQPGQ